MMDSEIKAKWIEALRSGKYNQGHQKLKLTTIDNKIEHCCLGVLCEIMGIPSVKEEEYANWIFTYNDAEYIAFPPMEINDRLGVVRYKFHEVAKLNDQYDKTFDQIADHIERNF